MNKVKKINTLMDMKKVHSPIQVPSGTIIADLETNDGLIICRTVGEVEVYVSDEEPITIPVNEELLKKCKCYRDFTKMPKEIQKAIEDRDYLHDPKLFIRKSNYFEMTFESTLFGETFTIIIDCEEMSKEELTNFLLDIVENKLIEYEYM